MPIICCPLTVVRFWLVGVKSYSQTQSVSTEHIQNLIPNSTYSKRKRASKTESFVLNIYCGIELEKKNGVEAIGMLQQ